jgi:hypothetical protein
MLKMYVDTCTRISQLALTAVSSSNNTGSVRLQDYIDWLLSIHFFTASLKKEQAPFHTFNLHGLFFFFKLNVTLSLVTGVHGPAP